MGGGSGCVCVGGGGAALANKNWRSFVASQTGEVGYFFEVRIR